MVVSSVLFQKLKKSALILGKNALIIVIYWFIGEKQEIFHCGAFPFRVVDIVFQSALISRKLSFPRKFLVARLTVNPAWKRKFRFLTLMMLNLLYLPTEGVFFQRKKLYESTIFDKFHLLTKNKTTSVNIAQFIRWYLALKQHDKKMPVMPLHNYCYVQNS